MTEPTTAAGRALNDVLRTFRDDNGLEAGGSAALIGVLLAIEAEARAAALDEAARAVDDIFTTEGFVRQSKILAAIDALREGER